VVACLLGRCDAPTATGCGRRRRGVVILHLVAERGLIHERLSKRQGHYMPPSLLDSQLETLEPLEADERGLVVPVDGPKEEVLAALLRRLERL
jgi:gluconate kinase